MPTVSNDEIYFTRVFVQSLLPPKCLGKEWPLPKEDTHDLNRGRQEKWNDAVEVLVSAEKLVA